MWRLNPKALGTRIREPFLNFTNHSSSSPVQMSHLAPCSFLNFLAPVSETSMGSKSWTSSTPWWKTFFLGSYPRHSSGSVHTPLDLGQ